MNNNFTKHCNIIGLAKNDGYNVWKIYLRPNGACQDELFTFGIPLSFEFPTQELAHKNALVYIDPLIDNWIEDIKENILNTTGEKV